MKITQQSTNALLFSAVAAVVVSFGFAEAQDFQEIADVPQTASAVFVSTPPCGEAKQRPVIMWTIEPADSVTVSTSPADLLTVKSSGGDLSFAWNEDVSSTAEGGGVKIGLPSGQLGSLNVASASIVQISGGFSALESIDVSGASGLTADLSSNSVPMNLRVSGASGVTIKSGSNVSGGDISGASTATIKATSLDGVNISGASNVKLDGELNGGNVSGASTVTATGGVIGQVQASGASNINAASCDLVEVSGASNCNAQSKTVDVTITEKPTTMTGTVDCFGGGIGGVLDSIFTPGSNSGSYASRPYSRSIFVTAVASVAIYVVM